MAFQERRWKVSGFAEVMRYRRIKAQAAHDAFVKQTIEASLATLSRGGKPRVTRQVAHAILIASPHMWNGTRLEVKGKSVGAGVWELST